MKIIRLGRVIVRKGNVNILAVGDVYFRINDIAVKWLEDLANNGIESKDIDTIFSELKKRKEFKILPIWNYPFYRTITLKGDSDV